MGRNGAYRALSRDEVRILESNGCTAESWETVSVASGFDPRRVRHVHFSGEICLGRNNRSITLDGLERNCGIYHAGLHSCSVGDDVLISNVGSVVCNYAIEDGAAVVDVSTIIAGEGAAFGYGVRVNVLNETGGRSVTLFNDLSAQIAYIQAFRRYDKKFQEQLDVIINRHIADSLPEVGRVGQHARVSGCGTLMDTYIGPHAVVRGALELSNGSVLSCSEHPTVVGPGVIARNFIFAEGSTVQGGAVLDHAFVGQGALVDRQCSIEHSLLFANSEALNSEICSVFAGPYSVTHHRSTLLIASLWSFLNAGSGTNQSNHMYKLGPVHQGVFERGCRTGSYAYVMMECHVPAFCLVIGGHSQNVNIPNFPFSYLYESEGKSMLMVGPNLFSVGTVRDGAKWPARDRRRSPCKRDLIIYDVISPYTVEKMRRGREILGQLYEKTSREADTVYYGGVNLKRVMLRKSSRYYTMAIDRYLIGGVMSRIEAGERGVKKWSELRADLLAGSEGPGPGSWVDACGLIMPLFRLQRLFEEIGGAHIDSVSGIIDYLLKSYRSYADDEWRYMYEAFKQEYGAYPDAISADEMRELIKRWRDCAKSLNDLTLENTRSEFSALSKISYGLDVDDASADLDFNTVRGSFETDPVVRQLAREGELIENRHENFKKLLEQHA
jgi:carbonic anhydrase/acetyltransferase-like protein (isoleucine patch superfamily)